MLFNYEDVDFDIDERAISQEECIKLFTPLIGIANRLGVEITEIVVESNDYAMILVAGSSEESYSNKTIEYADELTAYNIDISLADEDYGCLDAINVYF